MASRPARIRAPPDVDRFDDTVGLIVVDRQAPDGLEVRHLSAANMLGLLASHGPLAENRHQVRSVLPVGAPSVPVALSVLVKTAQDDSPIRVHVVNVGAI